MRLTPLIIWFFSAHMILATDVFAFSFLRDLYFPSTAVVHKQFNFHVVAPGIWRSADTDEAALKRMKQQGLKTLINLRRSPSNHRSEQDIAEKLGINYYHYPMNPKVRPDGRVLREILALINDPANQPVLFHCRSGKDRTGLIAGLYKIQYMEADVQTVYEEALLYGYNKNKYPVIADVLHNWPAGEVDRTLARGKPLRLSVQQEDASVRAYSSLLKPFTIEEVQKRLLDEQDANPLMTAYDVLVDLLR